MKTPIYIYDKLETDFTHKGEAILLTAINPVVSKVLNGDNTFTFGIPKEDEKYNYIEVENILKVEGQLYIIRDIIENKDLQGAIIADIYAEHVQSELLDGWIDSISLPSTSAQIALDAILNGTRFNGDASTLTGTKDFIIENVNPSKALNEYIKTFDCEVEFDNFNVAAKNQIGANNGVQFRYKKNLKNIQRETDTKGLITVLHVFGKNDLKTIVESPNKNLYATEKHAKVLYKNVDDLNTLTSMGEAYIAKHDTPKLTYKTTVIELKKHAKYDESESFNLGDVIKIYDEDFGEVLERIHEYTYNIDDPTQSRVVLANYEDSIDTTLAELQETKSIVDQVTYEGKIDSTWINGAIDALQTQIKASGAYATAEVVEDGGILFENTDATSEDYGALYIGPGIMAIASDKVDNEWSWRSFGTGAGFTADEIKAGTLLASLVKIQADNATYIDGNGVHILEGTKEHARLGEYDTNKFGVGIYNDLGNLVVELGGLDTDNDGITDLFGLMATHNDGSMTALTQDGLIRRVNGQDKQYNYLVEVGSGETGNATTGYFDDGGARDNNGSATNIGKTTITLPSDFQGKNFKIALSVKGGDPMDYASRDGEAFYIPTFDGKKYLQPVNIDYANATFDVEGWGFYYHDAGSGALYKKYYAIEFSYMVVV